MVRIVSTPLSVALADRNDRTLSVGEMLCSARKAAMRADDAASEQSAESPLRAVGLDGSSRWTGLGSCLASLGSMFWEFFVGCTVFKLVGLGGPNGPINTRRRPWLFHEGVTNV
jgi:hypothetical protein